MKIKVLESPLLRQYAVVATVNLSVIILGLGLAWPSPVLVKLRMRNETVLRAPITDEEASWIVSIGSLTGTFSLLFAAYIVDRLGRKFSVLLACFPRLPVYLLLTFASDVWMLLLGRAISGVLDTLTFTVVPMYASEVASKEVRGSLGMILQILCSLGILVTLAMGPFVSYLSLNVFCACATVVATIPIMFLPDSPYFLYSKGRNAEAIKVLTALRGSEELASEELKEYDSATTETKISKKDLFSNKIFLKSLFIVIVLGIGLQFVGFNAVSFYLQTILESTNTSIRPETASVIIGFIQLLASLCTAVITDRFGRKIILTVTLIAMAIGMVGLGTFFKIRDTTYSVNGIMNFVPLASLILVVYGYSAGPGAIFWMLVTELFEGPARATGVSCSLFTTCFSLFLTTKYFPLLTTGIGPAATYWIFGVNCVLFTLFILFCVPETKGKTFSEIQVSLGAPELVLDKMRKERDV